MKPAPSESPELLKVRAWLAELESAERERIIAFFLEKLEHERRKTKGQRQMQFRIALTDNPIRTDGEGNEFTKPISYFAGNLRSARNEAKGEAKAKGCRVEIHVTSERLLEAYERCEACEGSGKQCHVCNEAKGKCTCAVFDPIVCKVCSGEGLTVSAA